MGLSASQGGESPGFTYMTAGGERSSGKDEEEREERALAKGEVKYPNELGSIMLAELLKTDH